jgi:hypothetical protein
MTTRKLALTTIAVAAAAVLFAVTPSLLARGGGGGGRAGDTNGDNSADAPPPSDGPNPGQGGGFSGGKNDRGDGIDDDARDGAEQERIARDVVGGRARADYRGLRDDRNRRSAERGRDGSRR